MQGTSLAGRSILIVEDESLIALDLGYSHHGPACRSGFVVPNPANTSTLIETVVGLLR